MTGDARSPSRTSAAQDSAAVQTAASDSSAPCRGAFFAYDSQGGARGICALCEMDADVHEFDLPQDDR